MATSLPLYIYTLRYIKNRSKMKESINDFYKLTNLQTEINLRLNVNMTLIIF